MCTSLKNIAYSRREEHVKKTFVLEKFDRFLACVTKLFWLRTMYGFNYQEHCNWQGRKDITGNGYFRLSQEIQKEPTKVWLNKLCLMSETLNSSLRNAQNCRDHKTNEQNLMLYHDTQMNNSVDTHVSNRTCSQIQSKIKLLLMWFQRHPTRAPWNTRRYSVMRFWFWLKYEIGFFFSNMHLF